MFKDSVSIIPSTNVQQDTRDASGIDLHYYAQLRHHEEPVSEKKIIKNNELLNAARNLLMLLTQIKYTVEHPNVEKLKAQVIEEVKLFETKLAKATYPIRSIIAARYCLCTALDEAILSCAWGTQSVWIHQSLLSLFHKETWGGERVYIILEEMAKEPRKNLEFLEFIYVLLSLGFEGKFYGKNISIREEIRYRIFHRIRYAKEKPDKSLSVKKINNNIDNRKNVEFNSLSYILIVALCIVIAALVYFNILLYEAGMPLVHKLNRIATISPVRAFNEIIQNALTQKDIDK